MGEVKKYRQDLFYMVLCIVLVNAIILCLFYCWDKECDLAEKNSSGSTFETTRQGRK